jgi:hypothetical protein
VLGVERARDFSVDIALDGTVLTVATITQPATVRQGRRAQVLTWPVMSQAETVSHRNVGLPESNAHHSSGYTALSCTSPNPSTDRRTASPGLTNLVATILPVMTIIPCVRLLPCWASVLTSQSKASHG